MPQTVNLLQNALDNETGKVMQIIASLENDDLHDFIRALATLKVPQADGKIKDIINVAQNFRNIDSALDYFYVA